MNKLLLIISCAIGMPVLVILLFTFFTNGSIHLALEIENNETGEKKEFKYDSGDKED